jgi:hypothetical protein
MDKERKAQNIEGAQPHLSWFLIPIVIGVFISIGLHLSVAEICSAMQQEQSLSSIANTSWQLDGGWTNIIGSNGSELVAIGRGRAYYKDACAENAQTIKFRLKSLIGELQSNINIRGSDRYVIGFFNDENGLLSTYLFKQVGNPPPSKDYYRGRSIIYNSTEEFQVDFISLNNRVQTFIYKPGQRPEETQPVIDYYDPDPLLQGGIAFESLNDSKVRLNDFEVFCPLPYTEEEEPLDLGPINFKRPA